MAARNRWTGVLAWCVPASLLCWGCGTDVLANPEEGRFGHVFYLDAAGGGSLLLDWSAGVREGLRLAGYEGGFSNFRWQTGLGMAADHAAGNAYKRGKAARLAEMIRDSMAEYSERPVRLIGLSAGTALAIYTLESLREDHPVDQVVLLGSSLSSHFDLTAALKRVRNRITVFTSERDAVLTFLIPIAGTADREFCGACAAGLGGFHVPPGASADTREAYARVENVTWRPEFERAGNYGGHTDSANPRFVQDYVAPILLGDGPPFMQAVLQSGAPPEDAGKVPDNSDG